MSARSASYERGAAAMYRVLEGWKAFHPKFRLPPPDVALIASIADVGNYLACNDTARLVIRDAMEQCDLLKLGDYPTVMMLRACLEVLEIPVEHVPLDELDLPIAKGKT